MPLSLCSFDLALTNLLHAILSPLPSTHGSQALSQPHALGSCTIVVHHLFFLGSGSASRSLYGFPTAFTGLGIQLTLLFCSFVSVFFSLYFSFRFLHPPTVVHIYAFETSGFPSLLESRVMFALYHRRITRIVHTYTYCTTNIYIGTMPMLHDPKSRFGSLCRFDSTIASDTQVPCSQSQGIVSRVITCYRLGSFQLIQGFQPRDPDWLADPVLRCVAITFVE